MTLTFWDLVLLLSLNLLVWLGAAFLKPYLGRKGENYATHEDMQKLVDQVTATTKATEAIKSEITGRLWVSQESWKMKTDLYVRLLTMLHAFMDEAGKGLRAVESGRVPAVSEQDLAEDIRRIFVLVQIVSPQVMNALQDLRALERKAGVNDAQYFRETYDMYRNTYFQVAAVARHDLGFAEAALEGT